jgi:hypothetical protein
VSWYEFNTFHNVDTIFSFIILVDFSEYENYPAITSTALYSIKETLKGLILFTNKLISVSYCTTYSIAFINFAAILLFINGI